MSTKRKSPLVLGIGAVAVVAAGLFVYFGLLSNDAPEEFSLERGSTENTAAAPPAGELAGIWTIAGGEAGYRVREKLANLPAQSDAVGRTSAINGQVTIADESGSHTARNANFTVEVAQLKSDESRRDNRIRTTGLETDKYPQATFVADGPIAIPPDAVDGKVVTVQAEGDMTLHGVTKKISIPLQVQRNGDRIRIVGNYDFTWEDFGMTAPSVAGFVTVTGNPKLEFDVTLQKQA
jgi:polyisoprenoid-binding protein YceI